MAFGDARVLSADVLTSRPDAMRLLVAQLAGFIDNPLADLLITPEATTASPRKVAFQVRDRIDEPWPGRWWLLLAFGSAEFTLGTGQTLTVVTGSGFELAADSVLLVLTDATGLAEVEIDAAAGNRHVTASVVGRAQASGAIAIT